MKSIEETLPVSVQGTIFDVEAYNDGEKYPITIGYYTGNNVKVYQAEEEGEIAEMEAIAENTNLLPRPYFAYNSDAEEEVLPIEIDRDIFKHFKDRCMEKEEDNEIWCVKHKWVEEEKLKQFALETPDFSNGFLDKERWHELKTHDRVEKITCPECKMDAISVILLYRGIGSSEEILEQRLEANLPSKNWSGKMPKWPRLDELVPVPGLDYFDRGPDEGKKQVAPMWEKLTGSKFDFGESASIMLHNYNDLIRTAALLMWIESEEIWDIQILTDRAL
jgi:hypothetical protein